MTTAKALAICRVEFSASVADLFDVVRKHTVRWLSLTTAKANLNRLASPICPCDDRFAPRPILRREIERIGSLDLWLHRPCIEDANSRLERPQLGHVELTTQLDFFTDPICGCCRF